MNALPGFPAAIYDYIRATFADVNRKVCEKIARVPNTPEPSLDTTFIDVLAHYAAPMVVTPGWAVNISVHYLGQLRHWENWEIADIGVLVFAKRAGKIVARKVALLQSKRLYPDGAPVIEESLEDYILGFQRLLPDEASAPLNRPHTFDFSPQSRYAALLVKERQYAAIAKYERERRLPVHYLLYNPWIVPVRYSYPMTGITGLGFVSNGSCRIIPAKRLRRMMTNQPKGYKPTFADLTRATTPAPDHSHGWRLEYFMADMVMRCREGALFKDLREENIFALFNRRSGPIAAAFSVTVEQLLD